MTRFGSMIFAVAGSCGLFILPATDLKAACLRTIAGQWVAQQANGYTLNFNLRQTGAIVNGTVYADRVGTGNVSGTVGDNTVFLRVYWPKFSIGAYKGTFDNGGFIRGETYDETKGHWKTGAFQRYGWHSTSRAACR